MFFYFLKNWLSFGLATAEYFFVRLTLDASFYVEKFLVEVTIRSLLLRFDRRGIVEANNTKYRLPF
jgi:hypothetical protein